MCYKRGGTELQGSPSFPLSSVCPISGSSSQVTHTGTEALCTTAALSACLPVSLFARTSVAFHFLPLRFSLSPGAHSNGLRKLPAHPELIEEEAHSDALAPFAAAAASNSDPAQCVPMCVCVCVFCHCSSRYPGLECVCVCVCPSVSLSFCLSPTAFSALTLPFFSFFFSFSSSLLVITNCGPCRSRSTFQWGTHRCRCPPFLKVFQWTFMWTYQLRKVTEKRRERGGHRERMPPLLLVSIKAFCAQQPGGR